MRTVFTYLIAAAVLTVGGVNAARLFVAESWIYFALLGVAVPITATVEFLLAQRRGPEAADTANRLIAYVLLGLLSAVV
jgi:hypothetical protein